MTRPTKHFFFVDITRVYTMPRLVERGAAVDRTAQIWRSEDRPGGFRQSMKPGLPFGFHFRLARMVGGYVDRRVFFGGLSKPPPCSAQCSLRRWGLVCLIGIGGLAGNGFRFRLKNLSRKSDRLLAFIRVCGGSPRCPIFSLD
jgi:hypothetical protein